MSDRELYEEGLLMDLEKAKARIEALIAERDEAWRRAAHAEKMWGEAEVKLSENAKLRKALEIYERERARFRHAKPEMTGEYFLAGGHGPKDDNQMPQFVEIVPAYGCGWSMIYEDTGRTISYEGS